MHWQCGLRPGNWDWIVCLFSVEGDFKLGVLDWRGQTILPPVYEALRELHRGVAPFSRADRYTGLFGLLNQSGDVIKFPMFNYIGNFAEGLAPASLRDKQWGYINTSGDFVIEPRFQQACSFREGLACVTLKVPKGQRGNKGFINSAGEVVIEPAFMSQTGFHGGWADVDMEGKHGVIDRTGKLIWEEPLEFDPKSRRWV
ncbi:MAG TPA: WG repeat-containing protein [Methylomirabilota bacterium]|nr:WG repeat-containing protein [Methylomirabilota bacterium]